MVFCQFPSRGVLLITGLTPGSRYKVALTPAGTTPAATAALTTEKAESVPMGDFSDWERSIKYENLPCGGKFSASSAPVVNRQNFVNVDVNWPKHKWASMNAKTFNRKAANHNTWYMQPSAILENISEDTYTKAIAISSTGYDANGKDIPDYIQEEGQRLPYSAYFHFTRLFVRLYATYLRLSTSAPPLYAALSLRAARAVPRRPLLRARPPGGSDKHPQPVAYNQPCNCVEQVAPVHGVRYAGNTRQHRAEHKPRRYR